ncbi:hypothetical protein [Desulfotruncus alcoholivorax]|uniref:hypothetical protein n=1 Tax=Desulfotruncus alcoholivorax TaxID=265477 RepID=UPI00042462E7|nr:hypothetical protein [Desulfotruncus alcoholivorax]
MDIVLRGGIAGSIGVAAYGGTNWLLYHFGLLPYTGIHYNAVFLNPPGTPINTLTMTIGVLASFVTGSFVGVIISFLLQRTGNDYAWLKGMGVGVVLWPVHVAIIPNSMVPRVYSVLPPVMVLACFFFEALFGLVTGLVLQFLSKQEPDKIGD